MQMGGSLYPFFRLSNRLGVCAWMYVQVQIVSSNTSNKLWKLNNADYTAVESVSVSRDGNDFWVACTIWEEWAGWCLKGDFIQLIGCQK
jgi:hypothetical protein